jgi:CHAT domain-containing protein
VRAVAKPPAQPPSTIGVKHMAVMAGMYKAESGLRNLPEAEAEAKALLQSYKAVPLAANLTDVKRMLDAKLSQDFNEIGGVEAIHFAGHGDFDPAQTDSSVLMLSEGRPLPSIMFRSANYGGDKQPLFFLNGCMIGIGGELLGDMGGFPGNCLKGGFGGVVGALWEVDDKVAHQIALDFWQRALPAAGGKPEPVGEILRDLRAKYSATAAEPESTYLAYVYYGHPRLTLQKLA